jgi:hypothetical protein
LLLSSAPASVGVVAPLFLIIIIFTAAIH